MPRLEQTALHLQQRGDSRNLICFIERWAESGEVTAKARLAQAAAFLDLGLADRAWIRLQELGPAHVDAQVVTARMFLARGWRERARSTIEAIRPLIDDRRRPDLAALEARLAEPATDLPEVPPDSETRVEVLLPLAERYLVTGSFLKAQKALERLRKSHPDNRRVADLLWGLHGDFAGGNMTLANYVDRFGPDMPTISDHHHDESENTESLRRSGVQLDPDPDTDTGPAFPSLFRNTAPARPVSLGHDEAEVTQASRMTPQQRVEPLLPGAAGAAGPGEDRGDTQISRVIRNQDGSQRSPGDGPMHQPHSPPEAFDLAAFRREMGMEGDLGPARPGSSDLEDEDDARVELVPEPASAKSGPAEEPERTDGIRASIAEELAQEAAKPPVSKAAAAPRPKPSPVVDHHAATPEMAPRAPRRSRSSAMVPLWMLAAALVMLFVAMMLVALLLLQMLYMSS